MSNASGLPIYEADKRLGGAVSEAHDKMQAAQLDVAKALAMTLFQRIPLANFDTEVAAFWMPIKGSDALKHPLHAWAHNREMGKIAGSTIGIRAVIPSGKVNEAANIRLVPEHQRAIKLPDGRFVLPNGQLTSAPINEVGDGSRQCLYLPHIVPTAGGRGPSPTEREVLDDWTAKRGSREAAPIVRLTGRLITDNTLRAVEGYSESFAQLAGTWRHDMPTGADFFLQPLPPTNK